jgi:hypothetical protein
MILEHCIPTQPDVLWDRYKGSICDDLERVLIRRYDYIISSAELSSNLMS